MADHLPADVRQALTRIHHRARDKGDKKLRQLTEELDRKLAGMVPADDGGGMMKVESMVASQTKNPVVIFTWGTNKGELGPAQAKSYAMQIIEASEAATQDAALWRGVVDMDGGDEDMAIRLIQIIRDNRRHFEE